MELTIDRERLLKPLQLITNTVDRKQALPILSNILFKIADQKLTLLGTDLEIELVKYIDLHEAAEAITLAIPAKKLHDICRALPAQAELRFTQQGNQLLIRSGKSRFTLSLMAPEEFPTLECDTAPKHTFAIPAMLLRHLLINTYFSMAQQDVRYFLNGLFLDFQGAVVHAVATDGHRLSMCTRALDFTLNERVQVLLPRKAVIELMKLLENSDSVVDFCVGENYISVRSEDYCFTSKLIEGSFPEYRALIPKGTTKVATIQKEVLRDALARVAVLSNEKYRGAWLTFDNNRLKLEANNPDKDEALEEISIDYTQEPVRLGCNVTYLQEVLSVINEDVIRVCLTETSLLIQPLSSDNEHYVVMSMRL
ncbi:MAG: DNA polymerase III subunit beta [Pseudomonadota bacterium]